MVLDGVVGSSLEDFGDFSPFIVDDSVHQKEDPLLLFTPVNLLNEWVEMIVPSFSALLADSVSQVLCNKGPFLGAIGNDKLQYSPVFLLGPCSFDIGDFFFLRQLNKN